MAYRYRLSPLAIADIDDVLDYISEKLMNPGAANQLYLAIQQEIAIICDRPFAFPDCSYYLIYDKNIRHSVIGKYILIYEVSQSEAMIKVLRFLYGGRNISNLKLTTQ